MALLLVRQDVLVALDVANRAYVLENGRVALSGAAAEVKDDPGVRKAYLGLYSSENGVVPFGLHPMWAVAIVVIVLILFGVGRLPSVGGALGRGISEFRKSFRGDEPPSPPADSPKS